MNNDKAILYAYMAGGKLYGYSFAKSQFYPTAKEYILFNYHGGWNIEKVPPTQSQLSNIINPTKLIISITVMRFKW